MDEWFKFHMSWFSGLKRLRSDPAAAGRFILALMDFIESGAETELPGKEDILLVMAMADLKTDSAQREKKAAEQQAKTEKISEARSKAAKSRRQGESQGQDEEAFSAPDDSANVNNCVQMQTNDSNCMQMQTNDSKETHKNKEIRNKNEEVRYKEKEKEKDIRSKEMGAGGAHKESQTKRSESRQAGRSQTGWQPAQKIVTEAMYDQRPNTEPGMDSVPMWLTDIWNKKAAGLPVPSWAAGCKGGWSV